MVEQIFNKWAQSSRNLYKANRSTLTRLQKEDKVWGLCHIRTSCPRRLAVRHIYSTSNSNSMRLHRQLALVSPVCSQVVQEQPISHFIA